MKGLQPGNSHRALNSSVSPGILRRVDTYLVLRMDRRELVGFLFSTLLLKTITDLNLESFLPTPKLFSHSKSNADGAPKTASLLDKSSYQELHTQTEVNDEGTQPRLRNVSIKRTDTAFHTLPRNQHLLADQRRFFADFEFLYWHISGLYIHSYLTTDLHATFADHVDQ